MTTCRTYIVILTVASMAALLGPSSLQANIALRFIATQVNAPAAALVTAHRDEGGDLRLHVIRILYGVGVPKAFRPGNPDAFNEPLRDGREYVVLLNGTDAYRGALNQDGIPLIGCGVVNAMELSNGAVVKPDLYDLKYMTSSKRLELDTVERDLTQAHRKRNGV